MFIFCRNFKVFSNHILFLDFCLFLLKFHLLLFLLLLLFFYQQFNFFKKCFFLKNNLSVNFFFFKFLNVCIPQPYCRHQQQPEHAKHLPVVRKYRYFFKCFNLFICFPMYWGQQFFILILTVFFSFCFWFMQSLWAAERRHEHHRHAASHQHVLSLFQPKFAPKAMVSLDY